MWDPDLTPLPEGHDPWAWRAGVGLFAALLLIWHLFDLDRYVSFFGWAIGGAFLSLVFGMAVFNWRKERAGR